MARAAAPTAAQIRALRELRHPRGGDARKGVMLCPAPATLDEWETVAVKMQAELMQASSADRSEDAPKAEASDGGLADVTASYKNLAHTRP
jgi:hypothetical protein